MRAKVKRHDGTRVAKGDRAWHKSVGLLRRCARGRGWLSQVGLLLPYHHAPMHVARGHDVASGRRMIGCNGRARPVTRDRVPNYGRDLERGRKGRDAGGGRHLECGFPKRTPELPSAETTGTVQYTVVLSVALYTISLVWAPRHAWFDLGRHIDISP